ncbi:complement factor I isoform X2 [Hypomesus transpacificus]|uniref:complement factor I isoform X2 n=1 Tax=Hypomesus transpacificus TaxID=137520 RepID=UPI001F07745C|nr:complement factor I isoform X2 [Hypomesus transpacificus]
MRSSWIHETLVLILALLLTHTASQPATQEQSRVPNLPPREVPTQVPTQAPTQASLPRQDSVVGPPLCLGRNLTRHTCSHTLCPPWERCLRGMCVCKIPYQCPSEGQAFVCGLNGRRYASYCQVMAVSCTSKKPFMSHFGKKCTESQVFSSSLGQQGLVGLDLPGSGALLVCEEGWNTAAANVICRDQGGDQLGAHLAGSESYDSVSMDDKPDQCLRVRCQGYENSLAECSFSGLKTVGPRDKVATATCYSQTKEEACAGFLCVNRKCVETERTCDGVDDCGDLSDEMCCQQCRGDAFRCPSGVCVSREAVADGVQDCLDGADESHQDTSVVEKKFISPRKEIQIAKRTLMTLQCGRPNLTMVTQEEDSRTRHKRVVGGVPAKPTQIQWQVAIQDNGKEDCGGAYLGGCWVLTAAHCVRPRPNNFMVKFSVWKKRSPQGTTDIVPVKEIHIHYKFDSGTYENDIALIELKKLPFEERCLDENPAVSAVCVPWTQQLFQPNHTCSISGWGRDKEGNSANELLWANVSLIPDCEKYYKDRFKPGMMCAGDLDGNVDSCQGDSGGPLVCEDPLGVSYLWGIVSWGEKCGAVGYPGVYTEVAHYFEWIRGITGWDAITRHL